MGNFEEKKNKVLIIDDNKVTRQLAIALLSKKDYTVLSAENGNQGIGMAKTHEPQVILLDVMMPEMDGYEVCKILKSDDQTKNIPIIMVTGKAESMDKINAFELGAADYVTKPFDYAELQARVTTQIKMKNLWDEVQDKNRQLQEIVKTDWLTSLYNHRHFHERILEEFNRAKRYKLPLSCTLVDIDNFKKVNDTYGHQAGDEVLKSMSNIFRESIRDVDFAARYGGEEFALVFPHTLLDVAEHICERLRKKIESEVFIFNQTKIKITISLGVSGTLENKTTSYDELIRFADEALYAAKAEGKNRVKVFKNQKIITKKDSRPLISDA